MSLQTFKWETHLLALAHQALDRHLHEEQVTQVQAPNLDYAYRYCENLTQQHSRTFFMASSLLPTPKKRAVRALYAFCRISDDLVDQANGNGAQDLEVWRSRMSHPSADEPVSLAWNDTRRNFQIPRLYAEQLIDGVAQDYHTSRYETFSELAKYCYGVACTVGLMSMHIVGYSGREAFPYAIRLGVALQLTNILRDVREDWRAGRVYLPKEELEDFGIDESDLAEGKLSDRWRKFMRFQIDRNRDLYAQALPGVSLLDPDGRFAIAAAAELYRAILDDIEAHDYDVFTRRSAVSKWGKLRRLPGIWWRSRQ